MLGRRGTFWLLYLPPLLWLFAFFLVPLGLMGVVSLRADIRGGLVDLASPTFEQYARVFGTASYLRLLGVSVTMALGVAVAATGLAYPVAYFLAFRAGRRAALFLILLLVPFWTSYLLRVMAWKLMLGSEGAVNSLLMWSGLIDRPLDALLYNRGTVILTLIYVWIPFAVLPIYAAMLRIDHSLFEAAADLGAPPWRRFWRVTMPLALPGTLAAFFMVFIPTVGEYVTPLLVGGSGGSMYGNIVQDFFTKAVNWPLGSALAIVMLTLTVALVAVALRLIDLRRMVA
ncbi:MAG: ABC transporter permease [Chloroflexota bacterium]|nr:ABC transporter permease [Chloroflexota bacterium]